MDKTIFKKLGLNDREILVYLTLLEYGAISVRGLADITGINRGSVYDILKRLQELQLASYYHSSTKQKFVAEDPEKVLSLLKSQEEELAKTKESFRMILPELRAIQGKEGAKPTTKFYEGKNGIRVILQDLLEAMSQAGPDKEYYVYSATKASDDINAAFPGFTKERIRSGIKVKAISMAPGGKVSGLDERKWLGTKHDSATFVLIYRGKVAYISRDSLENPLGVMIENRNIYETQKNIFLSLWQYLK